MKNLDYLSKTKGFSNVREIGEEALAFTLHLDHLEFFDEGSDDYKKSEVSSEHFVDMLVIRKPELFSNYILYARPDILTQGEATNSLAAFPHLVLPFGLNKYTTPYLQRHPTIHGGIQVLDPDELARRMGRYRFHVPAVLDIEGELYVGLINDSSAQHQNLVNMLKQDDALAIGLTLKHQVTKVHPKIPVGLLRPREGEVENYSITQFNAWVD